ncbi:MAG: peptidylprolyl isomerase [Desulfovibrionaceae bacterium]
MLTPATPFFIEAKIMKIARIETSLGTIEVELNEAKAPKTVENFERYAKEGFYNGTIFHRVIDGFMIQGGGFTPDMNQKKNYEPIINEADNGLKNDKYTIAMARTNVPDSATSQFFINVKDNDFLNFTQKTTNGWGYAVFGKVIKGQDIVDKIAKVETGSHSMFQDVPKEEVLIKKVTIL